MAVTATATTNTADVVSSSSMGGGPATTATTTTATTTTSVGTGGNGGYMWGAELKHLQELDLGNVPQGQFIEFPIPDRTLGFTIWAKGPIENKAIGVYRVKPAGGSSVIFDFALSGKSTQVYADLGWINASVPQSDAPAAWPMKIGDWLVVFGSDGSPTSVDAKIFARRTKDGKFHGGEFDVKVHIAPGTVNNAYMSSVVGALSTFVSPTGVSVGNVTFTTIPANFTTIGDYAELKALLKVGTGTTPQLNLYVVGDFGNPNFGKAIGVAGGIPGSAMVHGTGRSGVAYVPSGSATYDAGVLAHEVGHLMGLFHTTESQIDETDAIADTPECPQSTLKNNPKSCPDVSNVMFPTAYGGTTFSEFQKIVVQGSALYRGVLAAGEQPAPPDQMAPAPKGKQASIYAWSQMPVLTQTTSRQPADDIEWMLAAHWCAQSDHGAMIHGVLAANRARVLELALDPGAFDLVRAKALAVLGDTAATASMEAELIAVSKMLLLSPTSGRMVRVAAIEQLEILQPKALTVFAKALRSIGDLVIDAQLDRIGLP